MNTRHNQSLRAYLTPYIVNIIVVGLAMVMLFALWKGDVTGALGGWLIGALLIIGYRLYRFYRA